MFRRALGVLGVLGIVASFVLIATTAVAQPVITGWRPPTGCSTNQVIGWNGSTWTCQTIATFSTNNVIPKGNGTTLVSSSITDDGLDVVINRDRFYLSPNASSRLRFASTASANYLQSGVDGTVGSVLPLVFTGISASPEWARFDTNGDLGVGDGSPDNRLTVSGAASATSGFYTNEARTIGMNESSGSLQFRTNNLDAQMLIDSSGRTTITAPLSDATTFTHTLNLRNSTADNAARLSFEDSTTGAVEATINGSRVSGGGGYLAFYTRASGDGALDHRMRIERDGDVCIGATSCTNRLQVAGNTYVTADFQTDGSNTLGNASSDTTTINGTAIVKGLRGNKQTYTTPTGAQTVTLNADTSIVEFNATTQIDLVGFTGGAADRIVLLRNKGTANVLIYAENGAASAADRIDLDELGFGYLVNGSGMALAIYDATLSRWHIAWLMGKNTPGELTINGSAIISNNVSADGNATLGNASGDTHTVNGGMTVTNGLTVNSSGLTVTASGLTVQGGTAQFDQNVIVGDAPATDTLTVNAKINSHVYYTGTAPALSSCGTSPSIVGNDRVGTVTGGTGSPTGCTLTFASAYSTNAPVCVISTNADPGTARVWISSVSTTAMTVSFNVAQNSFPWSYHCSGRL